ncbi:MAG TPA: tyrosine-type recombinase/integrase, partial [Vicinamibacterales bacterium]|nr:tyrosine-type recombinase/integrase [Vicinamibacterales bacterium]
MREFRTSWPDSPISAAKNLERLRSFFRFCMDANWLDSNPASPLKPPKVGKASERVKVFTAAEIKRILKACDQYPERNAFGHDNPARVRAFVLTLRYSGLRIGDVVGLQRRDLQDDRLQLRTAKTGEPVYVPLPADAVDALNDVQGNGDRFFW